MRFDDMLATVLARVPERPSARVTQWRQLLDLLAQRRAEDGDALLEDALGRIRALRDVVPLGARRDAAASLAVRPLAPALVALVAEDVPAVAGALLSRVVLADHEWLWLLPQLSAANRVFLRQRRDLGGYVEAALAGFGASDFVLAEPVGAARPARAEPRFDDGDDEAEPELPLEEEGDAPFAPGEGEGQIRSIISRIARFRTRREDEAVPPAPAQRASLIRFETDSAGIFRWVEGVPRGPLIGETIATPASGAYGVDGQAPGAFRRRAAFRNARLMVAGQGPAAGEWRIAGVPVFDPRDGRFLGYRGTGRRPRADERAEAAAHPDSLRQLVHELRTPLNAIGGFAEMIRRQMRGPVASAYRDRAAGIVEQAGRLMTAVDDLDVAARLDGRQLDLQRAALDLPALIAPICAEQAEASAARGVTFRWSIAPDLPLALGDASALRRMIARLASAAAAVAEPGETVVLEARAEGTGALLRVTRPPRLAALDEAALFDPGFGLAGAEGDGPLLGLGFSLHLVRRLAQLAGGQLRVEQGWFTLALVEAAAEVERPTG
ncbi:sensor histidine kinase [Sphingomonas morindae]|uniref:histidine kinase n=1 Tax=Sphingomonas morindae TaxID=1541170 RepID=A0ABY4X7P9_9SPHN|nr:HAMP domain-containing sensor histidine kinase [Sphingomonas morindae]USI72974.1 HAMP domain-containing histidine kinase [Sphingomonas morindae]